MQFSFTPLLLILTLYLTNVLSIPVSDSSLSLFPSLEDSSLEVRGAARAPVTPPTPPTPPAPPANCPSQKPIASNLCTSGAPYCCSGTGSGQVCGPASSTTCSSTTICCINTNGMQICAGEIDFTGPVTININL